MIALYAITDHPTPPLPGDHAMRVVALGELAAVCGPAAGREVTADALWEHERIVEALMDDRDVLPVRFGTCLPDEDATAQALRQGYGRYLASLDTVRGAVELAVRVFPSSGASSAEGSTASTSGTEYLRARARRTAEESEATALVHAPLARLARATTIARVNRPGELLRAAFLVDRDETASFSGRVREIQDANPRLRISCTGPWPPYSFAGS